MKKKFLYLFVLITIIVIISYSYKAFLNKDVKTNIQFNLLNTSKSVVENTEQFSQAKAFIPDNKFLDYINVKDDKFSYIKLTNNQPVITGKIILENNTEDNMKIQSFFIQGDNIAKVKLHSSKKWKDFITYNVKPKSSIEINVDIQWDKTGLDELTFFPLDHTSPIDRYNGGNLSTFRYFVLDNNDNIINKNLLDKQTFKLSDEKEIENQSFFPIPQWIDKNGEEVKYVKKKGGLFTEAPISGVKLESVPYNSEFDVLLMDDQGNISVLFKNINIEKNKPTSIYFNSEILQKLHNSDNKQFVIMVNNRSIDILMDMKALDLELKPFSTTYQSVLEFYKENK